jgi:hypothetical protein
MLIISSNVMAGLLDTTCDDPDPLSREIFLHSEIGGPRKVPESSLSMSCCSPRDYGIMGQKKGSIFAGASLALGFGLYSGFVRSMVAGFLLGADGLHAFSR